MSGRTRRRYLDVSWGQAHLIEAPADGPLIVWLHRVSSGSSQFLVLLEPLAQRGYHVAAVDLPGYGMSDPPPSPDPTLAWYADFAIDVVHQLGHASAWLGGNKTGVSVALQAAVDQPADVDGLLLWSVPYFDADMAHFLATEINPVYGPDGAGIVERWKSVYHSCSPRLAEFIASRELGELMLAAPRHALAHRALGRADHRALLRAARQPTLLFANQDDLCLVETRQSAELMTSATLVEFDYPEAFIADEHPTEVATLIDDFIGEPDPRSVMTVNDEVAHFLVADGAPIPDNVRHEAKRALLNCFAAALFARADPTIAILRNWAARPDAVDGGAALLWTGQQAAPHDAALVNAAMMHVADFDDTHRPTYAHPTAAVSAALLAASTGRTVTGREFLDAFIRGVEAELLYAEVLFPSHYLRGFHITATTGVLGAAAACAVLDGLDEDHTGHALGLAAASAAGLVEMLGTSANAYQVGNSARLGMVAAELAGRGLDSVATAFDGDRGLLHAASDESAERAADAVKTLGERWRLLDVSYKAFATETITQAPLQAILALRARIPEQRRRHLRRAELVGKPIVVDVVGQRARKFGEYPTTAMHARFDIRYCVAAAWVTGRWTPAELTEAARADPVVRSLHDDLVVISHGRADGNDVRLRLIFDDGSTEEEYVEAFLGSAENPMSDDDLVAKLNGAAAADDALDQVAVAELPGRLWDLDSADSLEPLVTALTGGTHRAA